MRANVAEAFRGLAILEQTPDILDTMISATSAEDRAWRPAPDRWSIDQVLAHLADSEVNNFNRRLRAMANGGTPKLPVYDQEAVVNAERFDGYAELEKLRERRAETVAWLRALPPDVVDRDGVHGEIGRITEHPVGGWFFRRQASKMPAYGKFLSPDDVGAIGAYVKWIRAGSWRPGLQ